jgi:hypothetical protein
MSLQEEHRLAAMVCTGQQQATVNLERSIMLQGAPLAYMDNNPRVEAS